MGKRKDRKKAERSCIACGHGSDQVPLLRLEYRGAKRYVCPQHLPVLIHEPHRLAGVLEGAERFEPAERGD